MPPEKCVAKKSRAANPKYAITNPKAVSKERVQQAKPTFAWVEVGLPCPAWKVHKDSAHEENVLEG